MPRLQLGFALALTLLAAGCGDLMPGQPGAGREESEVGPFDGVYVLDQGDEPAPADDEVAALSALTGTMFSPLTVRGNRIRYGTLIVGEFELEDPVVDGDVLKSRALWYEDVHDAGDMSEVLLTLRRDGERLHLSVVDAEDPEDEPVTLVYRRKSL